MASIPAGTASSSITAATRSMRRCSSSHRSDFSPRDPKVQGTVAAIERELLHDGFVLRYSTGEVDDGVGGREGAFLACSFWLADAYVMQGRVEEATGLFERLLALRNDLGLLAEEYDPVDRRQLGNFPQGFSHIGLVNTACNLVDAHGPAQQRAERVAPASRRETRAAHT